MDIVRSYNFSVIKAIQMVLDVLHEYRPIQEIQEAGGGPRSIRKS